MADLVKENLYEVLGVEETADKKQILKAYRKKALKCHPDKNPDNPKAAEEFHLLSKALEVLTDAAVKAAYDKLRQARKAAEARTRALDSKRRKLKEDLEARELAAQNVSTERKKQNDNKTAEQKLRSEIERLRKEGSSILKQEQEEMLRQMKEDAGGKSTCRIRLRWNGKASRQYTEQELEDIFSKHGSVTTVLISSKKPGSALLELQPSSRAKSYLHEVGVVENPLRVNVIGQENVTSQKVPETSKTQEYRKPTPSFHEDFETSVLGKMIAAQRAKEAQVKNNESSTECEKSTEAEASSNEDRTAEATTFTPPDLTFDPPPAPYESVLAADARRRAERQRLIEQMMKEDEET